MSGDLLKAGMMWTRQMQKCGLPHLLYFSACSARYPEDYVVQSLTYAIYWNFVTVMVEREYY